MVEPARGGNTPASPDIFAFLQPVSAEARRSRLRLICAGDGVGEAASVAGDGVGAVVSTVEDEAAGAGNTAPLNMFDLSCFCVCDPSSARCL